MMNYWFCKPIVTSLSKKVLVLKEQIKVASQNNKVLLAVLWPDFLFSKGKNLKEFRRDRFLSNGNLTKLLQNWLLLLSRSKPIKNQMEAISCFQGKRLVEAELDRNSYRWWTMQPRAVRAFRRARIWRILQFSEPLSELKTRKDFQTRGYLLNLSRDKRWLTLRIRIDRLKRKPQAI